MHYNQSPGHDHLSHDADRPVANLVPIQKKSLSAGQRLQSGMPPHYPPWPTSHPGPLATPALEGQKPINRIRSEQMAEVDYNQETGLPMAFS